MKQTRSRQGRGRRQLEKQELVRLEEERFVGTFEMDFGNFASPNFSTLSRKSQKSKSEVILE